MGASPADIASLVEAVAARTRAAAADRGRPAPLVGVSGIDASGKGHVASRLAEGLGRVGLRAALIPLDPWHAPRTERLAGLSSGEDAGDRFYRRAFRWRPLFDTLIDPLRRDRAIELTTALISPADDTPTPHSFSFAGIDVVVLEGVFLFRRDLTARFSVRVWVDCTYATALARALARNQEGLDEGDIRAEYERIYWPAQRLHEALDNPRAAADIRFPNDPALR